MAEIHMLLIPTVILLTLHLIILYHHRRPQTFSHFAGTDFTSGVAFTALGHFCTTESAWLLLSLTAMAYTSPWEAVSVATGEFIFLCIAWFFVAPRVWNHSRKINATSIVDLLCSSTKGSQDLVRLALVIVVAVVLPAYIASQFIAVAKVTQSFFQLDETWGTCILGSALILIGSLNNFRAMHFTQTIYGLLRPFALALLLFTVLTSLYSSGFWLTIPDIIRGSFRNNDAQGTFGLLSIAFIGFNLLAMPQTLFRFMAAKDQSTLKRGAPIALSAHLLSVSAAITVGFLGKGLLPHLLDPEKLYCILSTHFATPLISGILFACVLGTIISSTDQLFHFVSLTIAWDFASQIQKDEISDKTRIGIARKTIILVGVISLLLALSELRVVGFVVRYATSCLTAGFGPLFLFSIASKKTSPDRAALAVILGPITSALYGRFFDPFNGAEIIAGIGVGTLCLLLPFRKNIKCGSF